MANVESAFGNEFEGGSQDGLIAAMMQAGFYPKPPDAVTHAETHISHLFFAGDLVYKVKKAVRFSFLDYSTLAKRRHYLQRELQLNRRLAPSVYLAVVPIALDENGWRLGDWSEPAEYALVMRRLPEKRMLPFLLERRQATPDMMAELAQLLAGFHGAAERVSATRLNDYPARLAQTWRENTSGLESFIVQDGEREALRLINDCGERFLDVQRDLLLRRALEGWVRDVHGDLHAEHICFAPEGIQIFDCIEFSAGLRRCDLASEIAFLTMDLAVRGGEALRGPFFARYRQLLPDAELAALLPFFECQRALVRAKVHALRLGRWNDETARYFAFARRFTWDNYKPAVVIVSGFSGSGKSTLARALGERLGLAVSNSDVVRKALSGKAGRRAVPLNAEIYSPAFTARTYARMAQDTDREMALGRGAILDATFGRKAQREKIAHLAIKRQVPLLMIHCSADEATTARRLRARAAHGTDISDGRWDVYVAQKAAYEPLSEFPPEHVLELDTDAPLERLLDACEKFLRARLERRREVGS